VSRALALIPDLLFGSNVLGSLSAAGIDVQLIGEADGIEQRLPGVEVLIVDLTGELDGASVLESLSASGALKDVRTLAFYSHVDATMRQRAQAAGFDAIVPRSRMAREGAELVAGLLASDAD
jgi:DNA-binding NarL/FixJ family response regulator